MISGQMKLLSAVVVTAAMIATMAVARTVHNHALAAGAQTAHDRATTGSAAGAAGGKIAPLQRHGYFACPLANAADCEKLELQLPM